MKRAVIAVAAGLLVCLVVWSQRDRLLVRPDAKVGLAPGGGFLLNSGWIVRPAGKQVPLSTLPLAARLVGNDRMLILQSGFRTPTLSLHDVATGAQQAQITLKDSLHGLVVRGNTAYVGGGTTGAVYEVR